MTITRVILRPSGTVPSGYNDGSPVTSTGIKIAAGALKDSADVVIAGVNFEVTDAFNSLTNVSEADDGSGWPQSAQDGLAVVNSSDAAQVVFNGLTDGDSVEVTLYSNYTSGSFITGLAVEGDTGDTFSGTVDPVSGTVADKELIGTVLIGAAGTLTVDVTATGTGLLNLIQLDITTPVSGPTVTGGTDPLVSDSVSWNMTGTDMDDVTVASIEDSTGTYSATQTIDSVGGTTQLNFITTSLGSAPTELPYTDTNWTLRRKITDGSTPDTDDFTAFNPPSAEQQYPLTLADALIATNQSVFDGLVIANTNQCTWPASYAGGTITPETATGNSTGRFTASGNGTGTFTVRLWQAGTWSTISVTTEAGVVVPPSDDVTPSQAMADALRAQGFVGGLADLQLQWLDDLGFTAGSLTDRWINMLNDSLVPPGGRGERLVAFYEAELGITLGTSGMTINELKRAYWLTQ